MTTTPMSAADLYACNGNVRALVDVWVDERRCPAPLGDCLEELGLPGAADCARWAATEPERSVLCPMIADGERGGKCGPFPSRLHDDVWFWSGTGSWAHLAPEGRFRGNSHGGHEIRGRTDLDTILLLLDHWVPRT